MKYMVFSTKGTNNVLYGTPEQAKSAIHSLESVGCFGWIVEVSEDPAFCDTDVSTHVKDELKAVAK